MPYAIDSFLRLPFLDVNPGIRKLKCSGEVEGCSRCTFEGVTCHYSVRKTMGRPRKRRREEEGYTERNGAIKEITRPNTQDPNPNALSYSGFDTANLQSVNSGGESLEQSVGIDSGAFGDQIDDNRFPLPQMPGLSPMVGFARWDPFQNPDTHSPVDTTLAELHTQPSSYNSTTSSLPSDITRGGCSCLASLYSSLATFQSLPDPSFPYSMGVLRTARRCACEVLRCPTCPRQYTLAVQNTMLLSTLVQLLIIEYAKLIKHIDERSMSGEKIAFRMGEVSSCLDTRHTGAPDCPMAINVDLDGEEWQMLARKAVKQEIVGTAENNECLLNNLQDMRKRRAVWHQSFSTGEQTYDAQTQNAVRAESRCEKTNHVCTQILHIDNLKRMLECLNI